MHLSLRKLTQLSEGGSVVLLSVLLQLLLQVAGDGYGNCFWF